MSCIGSKASYLLVQCPSKVSRSIAWLEGDISVVRNVKDIIMPLFFLHYSLSFLHIFWRMRDYCSMVD
jgi:hypothetical protein